MGNTVSIRNLGSVALADLLIKENAAYQPIAEKLSDCDGYLSIVDGNFLLSLNLNTDKEAFQSILDTLGVDVPFVRTALENLLKQQQQQQQQHHYQHQQQSCTFPRDDQQTAITEPSNLVTRDIPNTHKVTNEPTQPAASALQVPDTHDKHEGTDPSTRPDVPKNPGDAHETTAPRRYADVLATPVTTTAATAITAATADTKTTSKVPDMSIQQRRVFVARLPPQASWQDVKEHFGFVGRVVSVYIKKDYDTGASKGWGYVEYETCEMAQRAIATMRFMDGYKLYVGEYLADTNARKDTASCDGQVVPLAESVVALCQNCDPGGSWWAGDKIAPPFKRSLNLSGNGEEGKALYRNTCLYAQERGLVEMGRRNIKTGQFEVVQKTTFVHQDLSIENYFRLTSKGQRAAQLGPEEGRGAHVTESSPVAANNIQFATKPSIYDRITMAAPTALTFAQIATPSDATVKGEVQLFLAVAGSEPKLVGSIALVDSSPQIKQRLLPMPRTRNTQLKRSKQFQP